MANTISDLINQFRNIHRGRNWFGQSYETKLQDLNPEFRFVQPSPGVHSVAEILAHSTAWRKDAIIKIERGKGELTEASPLDWPELKDLKSKGWGLIYKEYVDSVDSLIRLLTEKDDTFLDELYSDPEFNGNFPYSFTVYGILQHDIYHLGQIGLVVSMLKMSEK